MNEKGYPGWKREDGRRKNLARSEQVDVQTSPDNTMLATLSPGLVSTCGSCFVAHDTLTLYHGLA